MWTRRNCGQRFLSRIVTILRSVLPCRMGFIFPPAAYKVSGTGLCAGLPEQETPEREEAMYKLFSQGAFPDLLRQPFSLQLADKSGNTIVLDVLPDVLGVGMDSDWIRTPLAATTAQRVADLFNASLITRKLSDAIWAACDKIAPIPEQWYNVDGGRKMLLTSSFMIHNAAIQKALAGTGYTKVSGTKKDVVLTPQLAAKPQATAIYGWQQLSGKPIQGLYLGHAIPYSDYSHGIRLIAKDCIVNGQPMLFADVLSSKTLCGLVSDEGPSSVSRYSTGSGGGMPGTGGKPPLGSPDNPIPIDQLPNASPPWVRPPAPGGTVVIPSPPMAKGQQENSSGGGAVLLAGIAIFAGIKIFGLLRLDGRKHPC